MDPVVSVIIPVHDTEQYLQECLDSVLAQTFDDFEVLCVDDSSTDNSLQLLQQYANQDSRIHVSSIERSNAGAARNHALRRARGKYLAFLDSDDFFEPTFLETLVGMAENLNLDVALCRSYLLDDQTKKRSNHNKPMLASLEANRVYSADELWHVAFRYAVGWPWDKLYRKSFVEENMLTFQEQSSTNDAFFVYMALALAKRFAYTNNRLVVHRVNNLRSIENTRDKSWENLFSAINAIEKALVQHNLYEDAAQSFENWIAEMCVWNIGSLRSSKAEFYQYVQNHYAELLASRPSEYFYVDDYGARFRAWRTCDFNSAGEIFRLLDERRKISQAHASLEREVARLRKIESSRSYAIGRKITAPYRRIKKLSSARS